MLDGHFSFKSAPDRVAARFNGENESIRRYVKHRGDAERLGCQTEVFVNVEKRPESATVAARSIEAKGLFQKEIQASRGRKPGAGKRRRQNKIWLTNQIVTAAAKDLVPGLSVDAAETDLSCGESAQPRRSRMSGPQKTLEAVLQGSVNVAF